MTMNLSPTDPRRELPSLADLARTMGAPVMQLTRWAKAGTITLEDPPSGSGNPARVHPAEAAAITDTWNRWRHLRAELDRVTTGDYYAERLAAYLNHTEPTT